MSPSSKQEQINRCAPSTRDDSTARARGGSCSRISVFVSLLFLLIYFTDVSLAQSDPVQNFCRRFGHQTAVVDRKLYIDGGFVNWNPLSNNPTNYTNTYLLYQDLNVNGSGGMPQLYANLSKNATIPSVHGGALWADDVNKRFYLFGGEYQESPPNEPDLYAYDTLNDYWQTVEGRPSSISDVSYGASVSVSETGDAYHYGGWLSNNSMARWTGPRKASTGLVNYKMDTNRWTNMTGPDALGRAEGVMVYIPASDGGMLVYFGGVVDLGNGTIVGQPMDTILLYDIASSRWYRQKASGNIPAMRARFCAGATWPDDQSSYNIYLYGGAGMPPNTSGFDDIYILSIPSFTWIKMYPDVNSSLEQYPHNTLTCNVIDRSQMIIIGGSFPLDETTCDAPEQFGSHGLDLGEQNSDNSPWFVYRQNLTSYAVPAVITDVIGGNAQGSASKLSPDGGFNASDLRLLMTRKYTAPERTPTRDVSSSGGSGTDDHTSSSSPPLSRGAIAGIAVGGSAIVVGAVAACWLCILRRRRERRRRTEHADRSRLSGSGVAGPAKDDVPPPPPPPFAGTQTYAGYDGSSGSPTGAWSSSSPASSPGYSAAAAAQQHSPLFSLERLRPTYGTRTGAVIPDYPVEMSVNDPHSIASEAPTSPAAYKGGLATPPINPVSPLAGGTRGPPGGMMMVVSPYSATSAGESAKWPDANWPFTAATAAATAAAVEPTYPRADQPMTPMSTPITASMQNVYAGAGFGPSELGTDRELRVLDEEGRARELRHETYYHR